MTVTQGGVARRSFVASAPEEPRRWNGISPFDVWSPARSAAGVLVVEDDETLRELIARKLQRNGFRTRAEGSAEAALEALGREQFDLVILDVGLPRMSGFEVCREIRTRSDVPVMFLTAADSVPDQLAGFDLGCDDYVVKPANLHEVVRRVRALLRRRRPQRTEPAELHGPGGVVVWLSARLVFVDGRRVELANKEFALLALLLERREQVLDADTISREVWGYETFGARNFMEKQVSRVRSKLRDAGADDVISTVRGAGYVIR